MRFFLYLLPVINIALQSDRKVATDIFTQFVELLSGSGVALGTKITSFLHMYNSTQKGLKAFVFKTLVSLCQREGQLDIIVQKARNVEHEQAQWELTADERKDLFLSVAQSLESAKDDGAFQVLHAYLR